ncbi:hypothetical protein [Alkalihalobacterium elongatum]|uniref:hypothetical protein n=1 Tax=Alkalihalobacterium elongatum TaxID=2675466 RepID=UPI001C1F26F3|nr:hypothetical protein [Alkalihalobacterium elongatum]
MTTLLGIESRWVGRSELEFPVTGRSRLETEISNLVLPVTGRNRLEKAKSNLLVISKIKIIAVKYTV